MGSILNTMESTINYRLDASFQVINRIVSTPGSAKKVLDFADKVIAGCNYYSSASYCPELVRSMKGTTELINLFNTVKNGMFWLNPFTKASIDQDRFQKTLMQSLGANTPCNQPGLANKLAEEVFKDSQTYYCEVDVFTALRQSLINHGVSVEEANRIASHVEIRQKSRSTLQLLSSFCSTTVGIVGNMRTLQKWGILDGARLAEIGKQVALIGGQSKVFAIAMRLGIDQTLGTITTIGISISLVDTILKSVTTKEGFDEAKSGKQHKKGQEALTKTLWDLGPTSLDLAALAIPLFFTVSPPVVLTLGIVSKGIGLFKVIYFD